MTENQNMLLAALRCIYQADRTSPLREVCKDAAQTIEHLTARVRELEADRDQWMSDCKTFHKEMEKREQQILSLPHDTSALDAYVSKKVKVLAWLVENSWVQWRAEDSLPPSINPDEFKRLPALDKEIEVK